MKVHTLAASNWNIYKDMKFNKVVGDKIYVGRFDRAEMGQLEVIILDFDRPMLPREKQESLSLSPFCLFIYKSGYWILLLFKRPTACDIWCLTSKAVEDNEIN